MECGRSQYTHAHTQKLISCLFLVTIVSYLSSYYMTYLVHVRLIKDLVGSNSSIVHLTSTQDDPKQRKPDISVAKSKIGWEPLVSVRDGLRKTVEVVLLIYISPAHQHKYVCIIVCVRVCMKCRSCAMELTYFSLHSTSKRSSMIWASLLPQDRT